MIDLEYVRRVLAALEGNNHDDLRWITTGEHAPVTFFCDCSDLFFWGTSDMEAITPENVGELERAIADVKAAGDPWAIHGPALFCARVRKERPQGAAYPGTDYAALWQLFDVCGPRKEPGIGNPRATPGEREERGNG